MNIITIYFTRSVTHSATTITIQSDFCKLPWAEWIIYNSILHPIIPACDS